MKSEDFEFIAKLLKEKSGLMVTPEKMYLLESRLNPLARKTNFATIDDLIMALRTGNQTLIKQVIDAMTTNESFFFRDTKPFDQFREFVLPYLIRTRAAQKSFRIWSAACSSGQEAYSLCMILRDFERELQGWKIEIIGTDLSTEILAKAREGMYTQFEVQRGLPIKFLVKFFTKQGELWQINQDIRNMVQYKEVNLLDDFSSLGVFDVIFCRNVLIYFDQADKTAILNRVSTVGTKDSFLYLGGAETVLGVTEKFKSIPGRRGIYIASTIDPAVFASMNAALAPAASAAPASAPAPVTPTATPAPAATPSAIPAVPPRPASTVPPAAVPSVSKPAGPIFNKPASPASTIPPRPVTPASSILNRPGVQPSPILNRPAAPASSINKPAAPVSSVFNKPAAPISSVFNKPAAPASPASPVPNRPAAVPPRPVTPASSILNRPTTPASSPAPVPPKPTAPDKA